MGADPVLNPDQTVKILRDPGAIDSFLLDSVLPFSTETQSGTSLGVQYEVCVWQFFSVPKHRLTLFSDLVQGEVGKGGTPCLAHGGDTCHSWQ